MPLISKEMPKVHKDSLIFCLTNSEPELELHDILDWLARYTDTTINYKENNPQNCQ
jgi:hypothetical protein